MKGSLMWLLLLAALAAGCGERGAKQPIAAGPQADPGGQPAAAPSPEGKTMDVTGTVRLNGIEGGFWTIVADGAAGSSYDTHDLPADFRKDGLRVAAKLKLRPDLSCFHMAGPIAEVVSIRTL